jgi:parvulin-like peptidyl-prolyl isomerase
VAGEKFADVAKEVTEDPGSKEQGGLYTDVPKGRMVPTFDEKMLSTPVGQVSEPFRTQYGWHILTVVAKHPAGPMTLDDAKDGIKKRLLEAKRFQVRDQMMQDAEKGAKVEILYAPFAEAAKPPEPPASPATPAAPPAAAAPTAPATPAAPAAPADAKPSDEGAEKK